MVWKSRRNSSVLAIYEHNEGECLLIGDMHFSQGHWSVASL